MGIRLSLIIDRSTFEVFRSIDKGKQSRRRTRGLDPALKRHLELQIKTLQNAARDPDKL
jgi:hypothetical protein